MKHFILIFFIFSNATLCIPTKDDKIKKLQDLGLNAQDYSEYDMDQALIFLKTKMGKDLLEGYLFLMDYYKHKKSKKHKSHQQYYGDGDAFSSWADCGE